MATDTPSPFTAELLRTVSFDHVEDGYDPIAVDVLLQRIADQLDQPNLETAAVEQTREERVGDRLLEAARETALHVLAAAHDEAMEILAAAEDEAARTVVAAVEQADAAVVEQTAHLVSLVAQVADGEEKLTSLVLDRNTVLSDLDQVISDAQAIVEVNRARTPELGETRLVVVPDDQNTDGDTDAATDGQTPEGDPFNE